jgi:hypothetical protein
MNTNSSVIGSAGILPAFFFADVPKSHAKKLICSEAWYFHRMYKTKRVAVVLTRCCLLMLLVLVGCHNDKVEWSYASLADVKKAEPSAQSWVPSDLLPKSSRNIEVVGELSPSKEWCAFEFTPSGSNGLLKNLNKVDTLPVGNVKNPHVPWWPTVLTGYLDMKEIRSVGLELFVVEKPANAVNTTIYLFALDLPKGRGYFYSTYK